MPEMDPRLALELPGTKQDAHTEIESLEEHMTFRSEQARRDMHALIDAIELMKYIDSHTR
jgi:hypothetical protein